MALVTCPDCSKQVSDAAPACPGCGRPLAAPAPAPVAPAPSQPIAVREVGGFLGQRGSAFGAMNVGCLALMIGGAVLALMVVAFSR